MSCTTSRLSLLRCFRCSSVPRQNGCSDAVCTGTRSKGCCGRIVGHFAELAMCCWVASVVGWPGLLSTVFFSFTGGLLLYPLFSFRLQGDYSFSSAYITFALLGKTDPLPPWPMRAACDKVSADWGVQVDGNVSDVRFALLSCAVRSPGKRASTVQKRNFPTLPPEFGFSLSSPPAPITQYQTFCCPSCLRHMSTWVYACECALPHAGSASGLVMSQS